MAFVAYVTGISTSTVCMDASRRDGICSICDRDLTSTVCMDASRRDGICSICDRDFNINCMYGCKQERWHL